MARSTGRKGYLLPTVLEPASYREVCVKIPDDPAHVRAFLGQIYRLQYWNTWQRNPTKEGRLAARAWQIPYDAVVAALDAAEGCGSTMLLRQNPNDACQLQFSNDDGATWELAFDYGLCLSPSEQAVLEMLRDQEQRIWDDAVSNTDINPNAPTTSFAAITGDTTGQLGMRGAALCYAAEVFVNWLIEAIRARRDNNLDILRIGGAFWGLVALLAGFFTAGTAWAIGAALASSTLGIAASLFAAYDDTILDSAFNQLKLQCLMIANLRGMAPTEENLPKLFDSPCGLTTDQQSLVDIAKLMMENPATRHDMFTAFINMLGDGMDLAEQNLITQDNCACEETDGFDVIFYFHGEWFFNTTRKGSVGNPQTWDIGEDTQINDGLRTISAGCSASFHLTKPIVVPPGSTITQIQMTIQSYGSANAHYVIKDGITTIWDAGVTSGPKALVSNPSINLGEGLHEIGLSAYNTGGCVQAIYAIRFLGTGTNPFGNCSLMEFAE